MAQYTITWIDKPGGSNNPHTRIRRVGGSGWEKTAQTVIADIKNGINTYVVNHNGWVYVTWGVREGVEYLKTKNDGTPLDNLLALTNVAKD
jgi:hypothetical protein